MNSFHFDPHHFTVTLILMEHNFSMQCNESALSAAHGFVQYICL